MPAICQRCGSETFTPNGRCEVCNEFPTLGRDIEKWILAHCAIPDRDQAGDRFVPTEEQRDFLYQHYRVNPHATRDRAMSARLGFDVWRDAWHYPRGSQLCRPQKWGKGPFSGAIVCVEAAGPALFAGWKDNGEPDGRPWPTPVIQITALSEDQTDNVWMALLPMIELGKFEHDIPDTALLRIYLPNGGYIEPVTASAKSRLGQRVTFLEQDQTESWLEQNGGRKLADNQRRNVAGMGGRWLSTCNAWDPAENSVAQYTAEIEVGLGGVYHDDVDAPESLSIRNKQDRRKALKQVYGDSYWVDLDRIEDEIIALLPRDPAQAERWFLNRKRATESAAFSLEKWGERSSKKEVERGALITVGVDGARFEDDLGIVGTEVETGYQFVLGHWSVPKDAPPDYEHPMDEVDGVMTDAWERFSVWRVYIDPGSTAGNIEPLVDRWQGRWGKAVVPWRMNQPKKTAYAVANFTAAINSGELSHDGDPALTQHIGNSHKHPTKVYDDDGRPMHVIAKDRSHSPFKMDLAAAAVLSWEARGDAIADGAQKRQYRAMGFH
jgi:hypothetical protein